MSLRRLAKKTLSFGVIKEHLMFESWNELIEGSVEGMELIEEKDWGLPWPDVESKDDVECNLRIFEISLLTMPHTKEYSDELNKLRIMEESRKKVKKLLAQRVRYIKLMTRKLFKHNTEKMSRAGYNYYTRLIAMMIGNFGFNTVYQLEIRISIFSIAFAFALILH